MKIKLKGSKIKAGRWYTGFIAKHTCTKSKLIVYVELDDDARVEYVKVIPLDERDNSKFASFARRMEIIDEDGVADTSELDGLAVKVLLQRGKDGILYVGSICIDYDYYEEMENNESEDYIYEGED